MATEFKDVEARLWKVADSLRANSGLKASEYSTPVLGLIFLKYADQRFREAQTRLESAYPGMELTRDDFQEEGVLYLRESARYAALLHLPESADIGQAINDAMRVIEEDNEDLAGTLPKDYRRIANSTLVSLLRAFNDIPTDIEGDAIGRIYEYFLGEFAMSEGQKGGEFFTPSSLVKLIVEIIEPFHGRIYDPAAGSGGMFVQSAEFVERRGGHPEKEVQFFGQEVSSDNLALSKVNLSVHGLLGDVRQANSYYFDMHDSVGKFDFVTSNPPINHGGVEKSRLAGQSRFPFGIPLGHNANYLWIQMFYSALNDTGRAGFVMANSASDARASELEIRTQLIQTQVVDVMIAIGPNMFYDSTLPRTLWFLDKGKDHTARADQVLFIDARNIYRKIDRARRDFPPDQIEFIANIVRLYRGETIETDQGSAEALSEYFADGQYRDVSGLCRAVALEEIEAEGWSLNPGRYVVSPDVLSLTHDPHSPPLSELVLEMEKGTGSDQFQFSLWDNSVFVSTSDSNQPARLEAVSGPSSRSLVQLRIDPEKALAMAVYNLLNSEIGRAQWARYSHGSTTPFVSLSDILRIRVSLPELGAQRKAVELAERVSTNLRHLEALRDELIAIAPDIWSLDANPISLDRRITDISSARIRDLDSYSRNQLSEWLETLPFPVASALRVWQGVGIERPQQKYEQLLKAFEATAEFLSVIALSAFSRSSESGAYLSGAASALKSQGHTLKRASFGSWRIVLEYFGSRIRKLGKENDNLVELFVDPDEKLQELLGKIELVNILGRVITMRNEWRGHDGVEVSNEIAIRRHETLLGELYQLQELMGDVWDGVDLVFANQCRPKRNTSINDLSLLTGSNSEFLSESRMLERCLDVDLLHLSWKHSDRVLTLLPLVQLGASPSSTKNACYFYSKIDSDGARFISYHYRDLPEVRFPGADISEVVPELFQ